ncbi:STAS domain-containing protein [Sphingomonas suaedae]|uniref:STAS domain-containing protein n=1 Tax=Sphingomonas suaedae TaxID=2599297 RepID=UPI003BAF6931
MRCQSVRGHPPSFGKCGFRKHETASIPSWRTARSAWARERRPRCDRARTRGCCRHTDLWGTRLERGCGLCLREGRGEAILAPASACPASRPGALPGADGRSPVDPLYIVSGRLDGLTAPALDEKLAATIGATAQTIIDMTGFDYVSSAGLHILLKAAKQAKSRSAKLPGPRRRVGPAMSNHAVDRAYGERPVLEACKHKPRAKK